MDCYRQFHADTHLSSRLARAVGVSIDDFDGVALEWYPSLEDLMTAVSWASEPKAAIIESESNINDFKSSLAMLAFDKASLWRATMSPDQRIPRGQGAQR